jgi:hypothetical protein
MNYLKKAEIIARFYSGDISKFVILNEYGSVKVNKDSIVDFAERNTENDLGEVVKIKERDFFF